MTVQQLIDELSQFPPFQTVSVGNSVDWVYEFTVEEFRDHVEIMIEGTLLEED